MVNRRISILLIALLGTVVHVFGQLLDETAASGPITKTQPAITSITIPNTDLVTRRMIKSNFWVSLDFGDRIIETADWPVGTNNVKVTFKLSAYKNGVLVDNVFGSGDYSLTISREATEAYFIRDFKPFIDNSSKTSLSFDVVKVEILSQNITNYSATLQNKIQLKWNFTGSYGVDVSSMVTTPQTASVSNANTNEVAFQWQLNNNYPITYFQLEVLRLFNDANENKNDTTKVNAVVDWAKAGKYLVKMPNEVTNGQYSLPFTLTEGSGFYLWRVRPVSEFYEGGQANTGNYAINWSASPADGEKVEVVATATPVHCIYFNDSQSSRNYSYSRQFTERGNNKELVTYANRLNQVRQTATYLPSEHVSIVTQTILDNTGRPALVTMPVPKGGKDLGYQSNLVTSTSGGLYTATNFDETNNFEAPDPISTTGAYAYYGDGNDNDIPSAQGYPFARTIFYNDGTGRVKEQSGVGLEHRLQNGVGATKHTTRYFYETATEEELVALFGDEAPNAENVFKTITIDPNQVATVSYTNKEGQTIATGLAYDDAEVGGLLPVGGSSSSQQSVINKVTTNVKTENGFMSSKRIRIAEQSSGSTIPLSIKYRVAKQTLDQGCLNLEFDCNYLLKIKVIKISENGTGEDQVIAEPLLTLKEAKVDNVTYEVLDLPNETFTVDVAAPGTYVVQKELIPQNVQTIVSTNTQEVGNQVTPITDLISGLLAKVETRGELNTFFHELVAISEALNSTSPLDFINLVHAENYAISDTWLTTVYSNNNVKQEFSLSLAPQNYDVNNLFLTAFSLSTPCCPNLEVPINWEPPFPCKTVDEMASVNDVPDYEKFMVETLYDCMPKKDNNGSDFGTVKEQVEFFYSKYLPGWDIGSDIDITQDAAGVIEIKQLPGVFNEMVYNMLQRYSTKDDGSNPTVQYECPYLFDKWSGVILELKQQLPGCGSFSFPKTNTNVSNEYSTQIESDETGEKPTKNHDEHFDSAFKGRGFLVRWLAKRKLSKRMRGLQVGATPDADFTLPDYHMVKSFLDYAGYKYAKILTPFDGTPHSADLYTANGFKYTDIDYVAGSEYVPLVYKYPYSNIKDYIDDDANLTSDGRHAYLPLIGSNGAWEPKDVNTQKPLFKFVRNPYYAFKYFHYDNMGKEKYQQLEAMTCFSDPNDCYLTENNNGKPYYKVSENTNKPGTWIRTTFPCCYPAGYNGTTVPEITPFCYEYTNYYGPGTSKKVVREFTDIGRVRCPQSSATWNPGQKYTFLTLLRNYVIPTDPTYNDVSEISLNDYITPQKWYVNTYKSETNEEDYLVTSLTGSAYPNEYVLMSETDGFPKLKDRSTGVITPIVNNGNFIMVEKEMVELLEECHDECDKKRSDFRQKLYEILNEKCYVIGGCRTADESTWNVVPEEDIEIILDELVAHCHGNCQLSTFSIESVASRHLNTLNTVSGPTAVTVKLEYGLGGHSDAAGAGYHDDNISLRSDFTGIAGNYIRYKPLDLDGDGNPDDWNLSWAQYTQLKQVKEWDFEITLPSKCNNNPGNTTAEHIGGATNEGTSHFVDRSVYEVNPMGVADESDSERNKPVNSPSMLLEIKATNKP